METNYRAGSVHTRSVVPRIPIGISRSMATASYPDDVAERSFQQRISVQKFDEQSTERVLAGTDHGCVRREYHEHLLQERSFSL